MTVPTSESKVAWREILNRQYASPLLLVCLGVWLHAADGLIVATMMPAIVGDIGGEAYVAWSIALYEIGSIIAGASGALFVLRYGVKPPMGMAATVFTVGCLISAIAPEMWTLLIGRLIQGIGGGGMTALAFISAARLFPTRLSARVMAAISALWGASAFFGPLIGGFFTTYASWRVGFLFFAVQAALLALWVLFRSQITDTATNSETVDAIPYRRLALLGVGVLMIANAGIEVGPVRTPIFLLAGICALAGFIWLDAQYTDTRILPKQPLNLRTPVGAAIVMTLCLNIGTMGLAAYGPLLMLIIHDTPPLVAGYVLASTSVGWTLAAIMVSGSPERFDPHFIAIGTILVAVSVAGLFFAMPRGPIGLITVFAFVEGVGYGMAWTFIVRRSRRLAAAADVERLSGALPTVARTGYAIGASITGILANAAGFSLAGSVADTSNVARIIFAGGLPFAALGLLAMASFISMRRPPA